MILGGGGEEKEMSLTRLLHGRRADRRARELFGPDERRQKYQDFATIVAGSTSGAVRRAVLFGFRFAF